MGRKADGMVVFYTTAGRRRNALNAVHLTWSLATERLALHHRMDQSAHRMALGL